MTVSTTSNKIVYQGDASTTTFTFGFPGVAASDVGVFFTDAAGTVTLVPSNQYTLTLNPPIGPNPTGIGGQVDYPLMGSPIALGTELTILRNLPEVQGTSLANQSVLYQTVIESALDYVTMLTQQISELLGRALSVAVSDPSPGSIPSAAARAGGFLAFDSSGDPIVGLVPPGGIVSGAMQPVVNAATLAAGRAAFGLGSMAVEIANLGLQVDVTGPGLVDVSSPIVDININTVLDTSSHLKHFALGASVTIQLPAAVSEWNGYAFWVHTKAFSASLAIDAADLFEGGSLGAGATLPPGSEALIITDGGVNGTWYIANARAPDAPAAPYQVVNKTANYTAIQSDNGFVFSLGGNALYTFTVAGAYTAPFGIKVVNEDSGRGKIIAVQGITNFILWPKQHIEIILDSVSGVFLVSDPGPWRPLVGAVFFVNATVGNDLNDGLVTGSGAFLTIQAAVDNIHVNYDATNAPPTIHLDDGTHNVGDGVLINYAMRGSTEMLIQGHVGSPASTIVSCSAGGVCFIGQEPATFTLDSIQLTTVGAGSTGISTRQFTTCDISNLIFVSFNGGTLISLTNKSSMGMIGPISTVGNFINGISVTDQSFFSCTTFSITVAAATCTQFFAVGFSSVVDGGCPVVDGGLVGKTYDVGYNSILKLNGMTPPGNVAGTVHDFSSAV